MKELMSNGFANSIAQAIEEMKVEQGDSFSLEHVNLAELERRTGVSRGKLPGKEAGDRLTANGHGSGSRAADHSRRVKKQELGCWLLFALLWFVISRQ